MKRFLRKSLNKLRDKLFSKIHSNYLIYNTCWEDPRIDRSLLEFDAESRIVMITSAGCNALDYLLDDPNQIHCVDMNPRQNGLLALKIALFRKGTQEQLFEFFGKGQSRHAREIYHDLLRGDMPDFATEFWDNKIRYFSPSNGRRTFYFYGTSGTFAWLFNKYLQHHPKWKRMTEQLLEAKSLAEQSEIYAHIEPRIVNRFTIWVISRQLTLSLLGIPRPQRELILREYPGRMAGYVSDNLRHIFTQLPIQDNYFWRVYLNGAYSKECCPNYLRPEHFDTLKARVERIQLYTMTLTDFMKRVPQAYSHYILLDHQDWLASFAPELLEEEWAHILQNSRSGTRILMRSASIKVDFFPEFIHKQIDFDHDRVAALHKKDRVGTYASTYLGQVR